MTAPIGIQLYTVRDAMNEDFTATVTKIAEMGYVGVETAGFPGTTPEGAAKLFAKLGLQVSSAHSPLPVGDNKNQVLDAMAALSTKRLVCPALMRDKFDTIDGIKEVCDVLNEAVAVCNANDLQLGYHNHWWEYLTVEGTPANQVMLENLDSSIYFELDTYWIQVGGQSPVETITSLGERAPLLHIKDGPATNDGDMTAVGSGVIDVPAIIAAGKEHAEWLIVELDRCATDMMEAVQESYTYLVGEGLARGNR
ncbi:MAG: sugar phosphate isomerase/epimerase [Chloroflexota bacterium]